MASLLRRKSCGGVDDDIREMIKELNQYLATDKAAYNPLAEKWQAVKSEIEEMIFKRRRNHGSYDIGCLQFSGLATDRGR